MRLACFALVREEDGARIVSLDEVARVRAHIRDAEKERTGPGGTNEAP